MMEKERALEFLKHGRSGVVVLRKPDGRVTFACPTPENLVSSLKRQRSLELRFWTEDNGAVVVKLEEGTDEVCGRSLKLTVYGVPPGKYAEQVFKP